jgi:hypothetical protein
VFGLAATQPTDFWAIISSSLVHYQGGHWSSPPVPLVLAPQSIWAAGPDDVWALDPTTLLHWNGLAWSVVAPPPFPPFTKLYVVSGSGPNDVWVSASDNLGGRWDGTQWTTWRSSQDMFAYIGSSLFVLSPTEAWAGGRGIAHFNGVWAPTPVLVGGIAGYPIIWGGQSDSVWALGDFGPPNNFIHWNGSAWAPAVMPTPAGSAIKGTSSHDVWWLDPGGTLAHYDGGEWATMGTFGDPPQPNQPSRVGWRALAAAAPGMAIVGATNGRVIRTDGGDVEVLAPGSAIEPADIWWDSSGNGWVVGTAGVMLKHSGDRWEPAAAGATNNLRSVWGFSADDVFVVGDGPSSSGVVLHWDGSAWSQLQHPKSVSAVWGAAPDDVWAFSRDAILHWNGMQWSEAPQPPATAGFNGYGTEFLSVWGSSASDVWAVGGEYAIHWDGTTWTAVKPAAQYVQFLEVSGTSPTDVWALATNIYASLYHFDGTSWSVVPNPPLMGANSLCMEVPGKVRLLDPGQTSVGPNPWTTTPIGLGDWATRIRCHGPGDLFILSRTGVATHP